MCVCGVCVLINRTVRLLINLYNESGCFQDPFLTGSYLCQRKEMKVSAAQLFPGRGLSVASTLAQSRTIVSAGSTKKVYYFTWEEWRAINENCTSCWMEILRRNATSCRRNKLT